MFPSHDPRGYQGQFPKQAQPSAQSPYQPRKYATEQRQKPKTILLTRTTKTGIGKQRIKTKFFSKPAYQPVYFDEDNLAIPGLYYESKKGALAEGFRHTDQTPLNKFMIKRVRVDKRKVRRGRDYKTNFKFNRVKGMYIEKEKYRKDKKAEVNIMNMIR